jgi:hypothetical protein
MILQRPLADDQNARRARRRTWLALPAVIIPSGAMVFSSAKPSMLASARNAFVAVVVAGITLLIEPVENDDLAFEGAAVGG